MYHEKFDLLLKVNIKLIFSRYDLVFHTNLNNMGMESNKQGRDEQEKTNL